MRTTKFNFTPYQRDRVQFFADALYKEGKNEKYFAECLVYLCRGLEVEVEPPPNCDPTERLTPEQVAADMRALAGELGYMLCGGVVIKL